MRAKFSTFPFRLLQAWLLSFVTLLCISNLCFAQAVDLGFSVPENKQVRVIISTDAKNEADDQFAIVHALLSPKLVVKGIIASQYQNTANLMKRDTDNTMLEGYVEIQHVLELMALKKSPSVYQGAPSPLENESTPLPSAGAQAIIAEALKTDARPLYVITLGPITDLASALLIEPKIANKLTAVWIGGGDYPKGDWEYNLFNDVHAANAILKSNMPVWQIPRAVYTTMRTSLSELAFRVKPQGQLGAYLFQQMNDFNHWAAGKFPDVNWPKGESWSLGDNPAVSVLLDEHEYGFKEQQRVYFDAKTFEYKPLNNTNTLRVYHYIDPRFTLEDLFAKLSLYATTVQ